jgi:hypothetical protein
MQVLLKDGSIKDVLNVEGNNYITKEGKKISFDDVVKVVETIPFFIKVAESIVSFFKTLFGKKKQ